MVGTLNWIMANRSSNAEIGYVSTKNVKCSGKYQLADSY